MHGTCTHLHRAESNNMLDSFIMTTGHTTKHIFHVVSYFNIYGPSFTPSMQQRLKKMLDMAKTW